MYTSRQARLVVAVLVLALLATSAVSLALQRTPVHPSAGYIDGGIDGPRPPKR